MRFARFFTFLLMLTVAFNSVEAQNNLGNTFQHAEKTCRKQWTKRGVLDDRMYRSCLKDQEEGLLKLNDIRGKYSKHSWYGNTEKSCINKWTKRGVIDLRMLGSCMDGQIDRYLDIEYLKSTNYDRPKLRACMWRWTKNNTINWRMVYYCYNKD